MILDQLLFLLLFVAYISFASTKVVQRLQKFAQIRLGPWLLLLLLLLPYILLAIPEASGVGEFGQGLVIMGLYLAMPALCSLYRPPHAKALHPLDIAAILFFWLPIEFDWLPPVYFNLSPDIELKGNLLLAILLALLCFLVFRPLPKIGYTFRLTLADLRPALLSLLLFSLTAIPFGILTRFLIPSITPFRPLQWVGSWLLGYLFTALPEELLFRGIIQNQLQQRFATLPRLTRWASLAALLVGSLIFGLAHLNNGTTNYPVPNWMYALMATAAGIAYGYTWHKTNKITASAFVHATVNFIWGILLGG